jgi:hypothetical protein
MHPDDQQQRSMTVHYETKRPQWDCLKEMQFRNRVREAWLETRVDEDLNDRVESEEMPSPHRYQMPTFTARMDPVKDPNHRCQALIPSYGCPLTLKPEVQAAFCFT